VQIGTVWAPSSLDYYVSWREHHPREPEILAFYEWIRAQLAF
jgi:LysR family transcriptional regulator, glycine cleavage system transcriptional activator